MERVAVRVRGRACPNYPFRSGYRGPPLVVSHSQIAAYDWEQQTITLTSEASTALAKALADAGAASADVQALTDFYASLGWGSAVSRALYTRAFVVLVEGEPVYGGIFLEFCCLGTTIKKVKTREKFRQVDFDYPLALAKLSNANGAKQYLLVSALGADKKSSIFYNQVKGEVEEAIGDVGFASYHIFRPSLLMGDRQEDRSGEEAAKVFFKYLGFLVPKKYKGMIRSKWRGRCRLLPNNSRPAGMFMSRPNCSSIKPNLNL